MAIIGQATMCFVWLISERFTLPQSLWRTTALPKRKLSNFKGSVHEAGSCEFKAFSRSDNGRFVFVVAANGVYQVRRDAHHRHVIQGIAFLRLTVFCDERCAHTLGELVATAMPD